MRLSLLTFRCSEDKSFFIHAPKKHRNVITITFSQYHAEFSVSRTRFTSRKFTKSMKGVQKCRPPKLINI